MKLPNDLKTELNTNSLSFQNSPQIQNSEENITIFDSKEDSNNVQEKSLEDIIDLFKKIYSDEKKPEKPWFQPLPEILEGGINPEKPTLPILGPDLLYPEKPTSRGGIMKPVIIDPTIFHKDKPDIMPMPGQGKDSEGWKLLYNKIDLDS